MTLADTEQAFSSVLELRELDDIAVLDGFLSTLSSNENIPPKLAVEIYRNNSISTRRRALQSIYPVVSRIVGAECFTMLSRDYIAAFPSLNPDLNLYGSEFASFLAGMVRRVEAFIGYEYLEDLATLEWRYHQAYYAEDDAEVNNSAQAADVSLQLCRSLFWLATPHPVYEIWLNHQGEQAAHNVDALENEDYLLVHRNNNQPLIQRIERDECRLLEIIYQHNSLEPVVESAIAEGVDVEHLVPAMVQRGWLSIRQG